MLAIGRALMSEPKLLLLDEPSLGLAPLVVERIGEVVREIKAKLGPLLSIPSHRGGRPQGFRRIVE